MLGTPPPGFNVPSINSQTVAGPSAQTMPGYQGGTAQGYNPTSSGWSMPSSAHYPSALPRMPGAPGGVMPPGAVSPQAAMMSRALGHQQGMR